MGRSSSCGYGQRGAIVSSGATHHVRGVESFGSLLAFELYRIALVQCLVPVLLDSGEVNEDILTGRALDKPVSFGSVEPLNNAIFLQANFLSDLIDHRRHASGTPPAAVVFPRQTRVT